MSSPPSAACIFHELIVSGWPLSNAVGEVPCMISVGGVEVVAGLAGDAAMVEGLAEGERLPLHAEQISAPSMTAAASRNRRRGRIPVGRVGRATTISVRSPVAT